MIHNNYIQNPARTSYILNRNSTNYKLYKLYDYSTNSHTISWLIAMCWQSVFIHYMAIISKPCLCESDCSESYLNHKCWGMLRVPHKWSWMPRGWGCYILSLWLNSWVSQLLQLLAVALTTTTKHWNTDPSYSQAGCHPIFTLVWLSH